MRERSDETRLNIENIINAPEKEESAIVERAKKRKPRPHPMKTIPENKAQGWSIFC